MKISIGSDHTALELKQELILFLEKQGHIVKDCGTFSKESCDYTDYGIQVAEDVQRGDADRGLVLCYTGIGMSIIANKIKGIRCALVHTVEEATLTRNHNDSNCLALSAKYTDFNLAKEIVSTWINTSFSNEERHKRRIDKITTYEEERK